MMTIAAQEKENMIREVIFRYEDDDGAVEKARKKLAIEEIVRCKDCKWAVRSGRGIVCSHDSRIPATHYMTDSDYCSYGKRKDD